MDSEIENKTQDQATEKESTREGGYNPAGGYQRNYHSNGRPQRPRINSQRAYSSDRGSSNNEGGFRPEGFGAGLQSSNGEHSQQRGGYQPRGGYGRPQGGGYNNNRAGGYQPRQQAGGYRPRYNNNNDSEGGYQPRQQGGYQPRQQGGYQPRQQGGYQPRQQGGGYNSNRGGGYNSNRGGGYNNNRGGGYNSNRGGGYNSNRGGGYNSNSRGGGYNNNRGGGYRQHTPGYDPNAKYSLKKRIEYKEENFDPTEPLRLNKYLANAGVCSRREADEFIQAGVVTVNGEVVTELGTKILRTDEVKFHDAPVSLEKKVYVLLNKPKDYVTTSDDPQQRKTVMDLVKDVCPERIYPVGRLDRNTTGVLLLTNDGDLASKLTHPKFLKKKVYHVHLDKNITAHDLQQIRDGITLDDGEIKADAVDYADERDKAQVGIEIHSGKNRIVRRIFESLGYRVTKLDRVQFAGLTKKNLRRGDWRFLTEKEVDMLRMGAFE
mgnify:CR=1 FL=1